MCPRPHNRYLQRLFALLLLGAVLWSSSVAATAMAMGCCTERQACCTLGTTLNCASCVSPLSAPSAQVSPRAPSQAPIITILYLPQAVCERSADIWRPPKPLAA
jgi:hypothetical protein